MSEIDPGVNHESDLTATGPMAIMARAAQDGASDAREAAARTWDATGLFMKRFVYTTCYTISYGVVFPSTLLARSIPKDNAVVRGLVDGAQAAMRKVDDLHGPALESGAAEPSLSLA